MSYGISISANGYEYAKAHCAEGVYDAINAGRKAVVWNPSAAWEEIPCGDTAILVTLHNGVVRYAYQSYDTPTEWLYVRPVKPVTSRIGAPDGNVWDTALALAVAIESLDVFDWIADGVIHFAE